MANNEGAYKWRVTRLQLESAAAAAANHAAAAQAAAAATAARTPHRGGSGLGAAATGGRHAGAGGPRHSNRGPALSGASPLSAGRRLPASARSISPGMPPAAWPPAACFCQIHHARHAACCLHPGSLVLHNRGIGAGLQLREREPGNAPPLPAKPCAQPRAPVGAEEERRRLREAASQHKYNQMAPPMAAYRSEMAVAAVETTLASGQGGAPGAASLAEKRALIARTAAELDEGARRKAEQVGRGAPAPCLAVHREVVCLPAGGQQAGGPARQCRVRWRRSWAG